MRTLHFDGRGHKILGYFEMIKYYAGRIASLAVLRRFSPTMYTCIPDVEIHVKKGQSDNLEVILVYPAETVHLTCQSTERRSAALRRLYKSGDLNWRRRDTAFEVIFYHAGCLIENISRERFSNPQGSE
jgi:hypothetical protein